MTPQRETPRAPRVKQQPLLPLTSSEPEDFGSVTLPLDELAQDPTTWHDRPEEPLTAPVSLPSQEAMTVRLGPLNLIERLEEYQSDENLAHAVIGLFVGAILGIIANWATNTPFQISSFSIVLIVLLVVLAISGGCYLKRIRRRKESVKRKLPTPQ